MAIGATQIDKGPLKRFANSKERKYVKRMLHRKMRRKMKASKDFVPHYNRYDGWVV